MKNFSLVMQKDLFEGTLKASVLLSPFKVRLLADIIILVRMTCYIILIHFCTVEN